MLVSFYFRSIWEETCFHLLDLVFIELISFRNKFMKWMFHIYTFVEPKSWRFFKKIVEERCERYFLTGNYVLFEDTNAVFEIRVVYKLKMVPTSKCNHSKCTIFQNVTQTFNTKICVLWSNQPGKWCSLCGFLTLSHIVIKGLWLRFVWTCYNCRKYTRKAL